MENINQIIDNGNEEIAKYLGWFKEDYQNGSWFVNTGISNIVVYSIHNNHPHTTLPFHRDWNYLMKVVDKINDDNKDIPIYVKFNGNACETHYYLHSYSPVNKLFKTTGETSIDAVWKAVAQYCEYYNKQDSEYYNKNK